jgi:periplasmic protein TonB
LRAPRTFPLLLPHDELLLRMNSSRAATIDLAGDTAPLTSTAFVIALAISILIHGIMLNVRFGFSNPNLLKSPNNALEVVLVNSKSATRPVKADVLAQANLDGGGNTDEELRAKTPLAVPQKDNEAKNETTMKQKVRKLEEKAKSLLTQIKSKKSVEQTPQEKPAEQAPSEPAPVDVVEKSLQMARLEAQIARRMEAYQQRPKRQFIGARAQEYRFALYVDNWREKVERIGNLNYPEEAKTRKVYGRLTLTVAIKDDGTIERVDVNKSSGHRVLDEAAKRIVFLAAPFARFPEDIAKDTDILEITRTWTFTREDQMVSE